MNLTTLVNLITEAAKFNQELVWESAPALSFSSNNENNTLVSISFEFEVAEDDCENEDEEETLDLDIWLCKNSNEVSVSHPYCSNLPELKEIAVAFFKENQA